MPGSRIRLAFARLLAACSLPLLAVSFLIVALATTAAALLPLSRRRKQVRQSAPQDLWTANEFAFERAIESYESLIDAQTDGQP